MDAATASMLVELAEEPSLWLPREPSLEILSAAGFSLVTHGRSADVLRIRLDGHEVDGALSMVRARLQARGLRGATWWVGEHSTPSDLAERLVQLGLDSAEPSTLTSFGIEHEPAGRAGAEVRRVESSEQFMQALEIEWAVFEVAQDELADRRRAAVEAWPAIVADGSSSTYIAYLEGKPAGFARAVFTPRAALLMGGATLAWARGGGVYTATVLARWQETVDRGLNRIAVSAGAMSAPALERLGFTTLGRVQLLRDRL